MNVSRNLGGTFGISLVQTLLAQRSQIHQAQYVETLNPLNPNYTHGIQQITHALVSQGVSQAQASKMAVGLLYRQLGQQANMLSYVDAFHILMIIIACALPLIFLMQGPTKRGQGASAAAVP